MKEYKLYKIRNIVNNTAYVGITSMSIQDRWYYHCLDYSGCVRLSNAIKKHGRESFVVEHLCSSLNKDDGFATEAYLIDYYNTLSPNGYNLMKSGGCLEFSEETIQKMKISQQTRWDTSSEEVRKQRLSGICEYLDDKKISVVSVNLYDYTVKEYSSIYSTSIDGFEQSSIYRILKKEAIYCNRHTFFEKKEGFDYVEETKKLIIKHNLQDIINNGEDLRGKLISNDWKNPEQRAKRVAAMIVAAEDRARPIIGISRFDASIKEYPSVNAAIKDGITWGSLRQALTQECKHAYNHAWFYKDSATTNEQYVEKAKALLGSKFCSLNMQPILATNEATGETIRFVNLYEVESKGFRLKEVRQVLIGRRRVHKGYTWVNV